MTTSSTKGTQRRIRNLGIFTSIAGALLLSAPTPSFAAPEGGASVRYSRKSGKVKTKNNLNTKFKTAQKAADKEKGRQEKMMSADQFAREKESVTREIADKQIGMLTRLLKATDATDPDYPDYLFRLSDHHLDKKAYFERQAGALYDKIYDAEDAKKKAVVTQLKQKQKAFEKKAVESSKNAVKVYKALVTRPQFAKYKDLDSALYFYAFELGQLKREAEMKDAYLRLIREYPQSKYIPNAYLSFADFYYGNNQIQDALKLYQKIVDGFKDSPVYAYALYKMGWCYLNPIGTAEPEYAKSLQKFDQTVKATLAGRAGSEANAKQLRRDARRDMVKAYVHSGKPSRAHDYFKSIGDGPKKDENMSRKQMELLAGAYFGEGMYVESTATFKKLQSVYEGDKQECTWQAQIVVNALATDNKDIQWKETQRLGQYWEQYRDSKFKKVTKKKCRDEARDTVQQMATVWHDEAEKTRVPATYDLSEKAYNSFLQFFPKDRSAYEMNYYYAEILWAQGVNLYNSKDRSVQEKGLVKFRAAHDEFLKVLERKKDGKYTKDAAYAQMLAMKNALEYDETGGRSKACKVNTEGVCIYRDKKKKKRANASKDTKTNTAADFKVTDYTEKEAGMLGSYDVYQKYIKDPKDKELPKIQYHRAKLMMEHNRFDEASPVLKELITKFDGSIYAAWASEMLIDLLTIRWTDKDNTPEQTVSSGEELEEWSRKLQKLKTYKHKEASRIREAIPTLLAGIGWKKAEAFQAQGKAGDPEGFVRCGDQYVLLWNDYEDHDKADILLFNAARCFEAAYLVGKAITLRGELLSRYPASSKYQQTLREVAENYQAIAFYDKAATHLELYADKYKKDDYSGPALSNAYIFREGLGDEAKAKANLEKYEALYKKKNPGKAAKIFWSKNELIDSDTAKAAHARQYIKTYGNRGGVDRRIVAEATVGQILWRQSCEKELLYDSCLTVKRKKATAGEDKREKAKKLRRKAKKKKKNDIPKFCGSSTQGLITVHGRDKKKAEQAQSHFKTVLKLGSKKATIPPEEKERVVAYKNAIGMSMVYAADQKYEEYLKISIPQDLEFYTEDYKKDSGIPKWEKEYKAQLKKKQESEKKFGEFFASKTKLGGELVKSYTGVKSSGSPFWVLAAAARTAVLSQNFADQLYRASVPKSIKTEDQYFVYCDALADAAAGPQKIAIGAFTYCLEKSTEFQYFNQFSRMCEEELQQRNPGQYPATNELFGTSIYTDSVLDVVGVQTDLSGGKKTADAPKKKKKAGKAGL